MKAVWNGAILPDSNNPIIIEGNHYFPLDAINKSLFKSSDNNTVCHWKGKVSYYAVEVDGQVNKEAA